MVRKEATDIKELPIVKVNQKAEVSEEISDRAWMKKFLVIKTLPSILDEFWTLALKVFVSISSIYFLIRIVFAFWADVNSTYATS